MKHGQGKLPRPRMPQEIRRLTTHSLHAMILAAAAEHNIFDAIGKGGATARQIQKKLRLDQRGAEILLNALTAMKILRKKGDHYANTPLSRRYLVSDSPTSIVGSLQNINNLYKTWSHLDQVLRTGRRRGISPWGRKSGMRRTAIFTRAMYNVGFEAAATLPDTVDLSGRRRLLDIGGGPGLYSFNLCKRYTDLTATVFDLPTTIRETRKYLKKYGMGKRMRALAGDYKKGELPRPFDAVLVSHIIHGMGEKGNRWLLKKVYRCLEPGGILILRDFLLNEGKTSPANAAVFAVNMLVNTENGRTYTFGEVGRWLRDAGFHKIKRVSRPSASGKNNASVMTALKPGS